MIAGCSVARGAENFASQDNGCSVVGGAEGFGFKDIDCSVVGGAEGFGFKDIDCSVVGGAEGFGGTFMVGFAYCHPSPLHALPHSCKWGNAVPMRISLWPPWAPPWHRGLLQLGVDLLV